MLSWGRDGSYMIFINGRRISPLTTILTIVAFVFLGVLLLPVIGGFFLFFLFCIFALSLYGMYRRWRYGDPLKRMQKEFESGMNKEQRRSDFEGQAGEKGNENRARVGVKRITEVEDAVIVDEISRRH